LLPDRNVHADILANLLYVTVGFSLVTILSRNLTSIRHIGQLWDALVSFAVLVFPSVMFIAYIKKHEHTSLMLGFDYLFVFFVSAYAFSLTPEGRAIEIVVLDRTMNLTVLSVVFMLSYPFLLQVVSLRKTFSGGNRGVLYNILLKAHTKNELSEITQTMWLAGLIALLSGSWELFAFIGSLYFGSEALWKAFGPIPESRLRAVLTAVFLLAIPTTVTILVHFGLVEIAEYVVFFEILTAIVLGHIAVRKMRIATSVRY